MEALLKDRIGKIEGLVAQIQNAANSDTRTAALELVQTVMDFHGAAIDRMMEIAADGGEQGWQIIDGFGADPLVSNLLLLHDLHPHDLESRVCRALESVRPYLRSHGGNVELVGVGDGVVQLRLVGTCHGCPSSTMTLKTAIETAIHEAAPDVRSIRCDDTPELVEIQTATATGVSPL